MKSLLELIATPVGRDRAPISTGFAKHDPEEDENRVNKEGGSRKAGVILGASLIAKGEALGHDMFIDEFALNQVVSLGSEPDTGVKVRFTHPSMSGDGLGSYLGRAKNLSLDGDRVRGDVHFSPSSRTTPDGDRGGYVMDLAAEDPDSFGMSIVFDHDRAAEQEFIDDNQQAVTPVDPNAEATEERFVSPDSENESNHYHVRFAALHGADFVDEPAANADGVFHRGPTADALRQAEAVVEFALGISDEAPEDSGGLSAQRLKGFLTRFLECRGLEITLQEKGAPVADAQTMDAEVLEVEAPVETTDTETVETFSRADVEKFSAKFGGDKGLKYLLAGTSFEAALSKEFDLLKQKKDVVGDDNGGEEEAVGEFAESDADPAAVRGLPASVQRFSQCFRLPGDASKN